MSRTGQGIPLSFGFVDSDPRSSVSPSVTASDRLKVRADSYSRDSQILRAEGDMPMAIAYQTIADELRKCAAEVAE
jgi:hypothetical protein